MSDNGYLKCPCSYCHGHLEFPAHAIGITTTCPHCGVETTLFDPAATHAAPVPQQAKRSLPVSHALSPAAQPFAESPACGPPFTVGSPLDFLPAAEGKFKRVLKVLSVLVGVAAVVFVAFNISVKLRRVESVVVVAKSGPKKDKSASVTEALKPAAKPMPMPAPILPPTSIVIAQGTPPARKPGEDLQVLSFEVQKVRDGNLQYVLGVVTNHAAKQFFKVKLEFEVTRADGKAAELATDSIRNLPANGGVTFKASIIGTAPVSGAKLAKLEGEKE